MILQSVRSGRSKGGAVGCLDLTMIVLISRSNPVVVYFSWISTFATRAHGVKVAGRSKCEQGIVRSFFRDSALLVAIICWRDSYRASEAQSEAQKPVQS